MVLKEYYCMATKLQLLLLLVWTVLGDGHGILCVYKRVDLYGHGEINYGREKHVPAIRSWLSGAGWMLVIYHRRNHWPSSSIIIVSSTHLRWYAGPSQRQWESICAIMFQCILWCLTNHPPLLLTLHLHSSITCQFSCFPPYPATTPFGWQDEGARELMIVSADCTSGT